MRKNNITGYNEAKAMMAFLCNSNMHNPECIEALKNDMCEKDIDVERFKRSIKWRLDCWLKNFDS